MLRMTKETRDKLTRYLNNADPFLWNVLENKNKKGRVKELREMGLLGGYSAGSNFTYAKINQDLLIELGVDGILERIVIPGVKRLFSPDIINYLRRCWEQGQAPTLKSLKERKLFRKRTFSGETVYDDNWPVASGYKEAAFVFVQIDTQHYFVERWTVFAGLWFEEIEPLLGPETGAAAL